MRSNHKSAIIFACCVLAGVACSPAQKNNADSRHSGPTMNYHKVNERLATGGHFVDDGLAELHGQGVRIIIDLRDKPPVRQKEKLAKLGIAWINVPVAWDDPKLVDFERFSAAMSENVDDNVLVQCQANYRASAMTYLYRVVVAGESEPDARKDLAAVWEPNDQWQEYMNSVIESAP